MKNYVLLTMSGILTLASCSRPPADSPVRGSGPLSLIQYTDYDCAACKASQPAVLALRVARPDVRLVFIGFPLSTTEQGLFKHILGRCIYRMDAQAFWMYYDLMFSDSRPARTDAAEMADLLQLDAAALQSCMREDSVKQGVLRDRKTAEDTGVVGTPTFVFEGRKIAGFVQPKALQEFIAGH